MMRFLRQKRGGDWLREGVIFLTAAIVFAVPLAAAEPYEDSLAAFLAGYVHEGSVHYAGLRAHPEVMDKVIRDLEAVTEKRYRGWEEADRIAFWINAYNVAAANLVFRNHPIENTSPFQGADYPAGSVQQIPRVWKRVCIRLLGKDRSLDEIEHEILRKEFRDPRILFALARASAGGPLLRGEPYTGPRLDKQLEEQVSAFLSDSENIRWDPLKHKLLLSPLFRWFEKDFESSGGFLAFVRRRWPEDKEPRLPAVKEASVEWLKYDWHLNEWRPSGEKSAADTGPRAKPGE